MTLNFHDLEDVAVAIQKCGLHTALQQGYRLACAVDGGSWGIGGRSVWLARWDNRWFVATWTPRIYVLPADSSNAKVVEIVDAVLSMSSTARLFEIPEPVRQKYDLSEISLEDYTACATRDLP